MATNMKQHKLGWIGIGRMGYAMAERLAKSGCDIAVWNRTKSKAEPLAKSGAKVVDHLTDLAGCDIVFTMVGAGKDVKEVLFGPSGVERVGQRGRRLVRAFLVGEVVVVHLRVIDRRRDRVVRIQDRLAAHVSGNNTINAITIPTVASGAL